MPLGNQNFTKFPIVIDFPVEHQHQRPVLIKNRLVAGVADIDNAQTAKAHRDAIPGKNTVGIRAAVGNHFRHIFYDLVTVNYFSGKPA